MYKNAQLKKILIISVIIMVILCFKLIFMRTSLMKYENQEMFNIMQEKKATPIEKFGYGDILECLAKNKSLEVKAINMMEAEKCNVEINYNGDINSLYDSLCYLKNNKNFLGVNNININMDTKITNISIDFKKNK